MTWAMFAACRGMDTEIFYAYEELRGKHRDLAKERARQVCASCPVQQQCYDHATQFPERHGVWAETTAHDRGFDYRGQRRKAVAA